VGQSDELAAMLNKALQAAFTIDISYISEVKRGKTSALDFEIDRLTNSIQNTISGDSFPTEVSLLTRADLKQITRKTVGRLIGSLNLTTMPGKFIS